MQASPGVHRGGNLGLSPRGQGGGRCPVGQCAPRGRAEHCRRDPNAGNGPCPTSSCLHTSSSPVAKRSPRPVLRRGRHEAPRRSPGRPGPGHRLRCRGAGARARRRALSGRQLQALAALDGAAGPAQDLGDDPRHQHHPRQRRHGGGEDLAAQPAACLPPEARAGDRAAVPGAEGGRRAPHAGVGRVPVPVGQDHPQGRWPDRRAEGLPGRAQRVPQHGPLGGPARPVRHGPPLHRPPEPAAHACRPVAHARRLGVPQP